ncbi:bifunctional DNA primase/polymerase [Alphaproteobacteria bacterium]|nr:bifunctional DNA primase/polymerase [Alphaproteobacteria bacterium]
MLSIQNTITAAQELADHFGWAVFPVNPKTKTPYFRGWQEIASSNPEKIEDIFSGLQYAAIGVCTGETSGLVCIDIDERADYSGLFNYQKAGFELPNCPIAQTPSGGLHLYFKQPSSKVKNSASLIARGVDVRGESGYIISPPSNTVFGTYSWKCSPETVLNGPIEMPSKLLEAIQSPTKKQNPAKVRSRLASQILTPILEGGRNQEITRRTGYLLAKYDARHAWEMTKMINRECCLPPLGEAELSNTFNSIRKKEGK